MDADREPLLYRVNARRRPSTLAPDVLASPPAHPAAAAASDAAMATAGAAAVLGLAAGSLVAGLGALLLRRREARATQDGARSAPRIRALP